MIALLANRWLWYVVSVVALGALLRWSFVEYVKNPYIAQGRAQLQPALNATVLQLKADTVAFKEIDGYMTALINDSKRIAAAGVEADKANDKRKSQEKIRIVYLDKFVPTGDTECERTSNAILKVLR